MDETKVDQIIDRHHGRASSLIQLLLDIQEESGWLSKEILERVSEKLQVPLGWVQQTATFYKAFRVVPRGEHVINVCNGTACHSRGAQHVLEKIEDLIGIRPGETNINHSFSLESRNCLGHCALGPVVEIDGKAHSIISLDEINDVIKKYE